MQGSQEVNWWAVIAPSLITGGVAIVVQILVALLVNMRLKQYESVLNRGIEDYKKDLSKEVFQFQTKFSLFHQKQAEIISELFELLVKTQIRLDHFVYKIEANPNWKELLDECNAFGIFFEKNKLYLGEKACALCEKARSSIFEMFSGYQTYLIVKEAAVTSDNERIGEYLNKALDMRESFVKAAVEDRKNLENEFRRVLGEQLPI